MVILGRKLKMTQVWKGNKVIPVTVIKVVPNKVTLLRTTERDGYQAVQLKLGRTKREFRLQGELKWNVGDEVSASAFEENDIVKVSGLNKGRGFQGVVKRHNFGGGPKTHGQKNRHRAGGSIGSTAPQRVWPGRRMAGHMGVERVTIKNLKIVGVDAEAGTLQVTGAVPGAPNGLVEIRKIGSKK